MAHVLLSTIAWYDLVVFDLLAVGDEDRSALPLRERLQGLASTKATSAERRYRRARIRDAPAESIRVNFDKDS